jgi:hypothetical protein
LASSATGTQGQEQKLLLLRRARLADQQLRIGFKVEKNMEPDFKKSINTIIRIDAFVLNDVNRHH